MKNIHYNDLVLSYKIYGDGPQHLICFHGHGKNHSDFESFENEQTTIYSFDLFGHGESQIDSARIPKEPLTKEELKSIFSQFLSVEKIDAFSLLAYSLGGKIAFNIFLWFPTQVKKIQLLAPDGLKSIPWYTSTAHSRTLQKAYKYTINKPKPFMSVVKATRKLRLLPLNLYKFLEFQFSTKEKRFLAYQTWCFYRNLFPEQNFLTESLQKYNPELQIIVGKFDKVIFPKFAHSFKKDLYGKTEIIELSIGHDFFKEKNLELVQKELKKTTYL